MRGIFGESREFANAVCAALSQSPVAGFLEKHERAELETLWVENSSLTKLPGDFLSGFSNLCCLKIISTRLEELPSE